MNRFCEHNKGGGFHNFLTPLRDGSNEMEAVEVPTYYTILWKLRFLSLLGINKTNTITHQLQEATFLHPKY
jgi:hypothetical protein